MNTLHKTGSVLGKLLCGLVLFAVLGTAANYLDSKTGIKINSCGGHGNTWLGENVFALGYGVDIRGDYYTSGILFIPGRLHIETFKCNQDGQ